MPDVGVLRGVDGAAAPAAHAGRRVGDAVARPCDRGRVDVDGPAGGAAAVQYIVDSSDFVRDFGPNSGREARMARAQTVVDSIPESTP